MKGTSRWWCDVGLLTLEVSSLPDQCSRVDADTRHFAFYCRIVELARGAKPLIRMKGNQTFLDPPEAGSAQAHASGGRATEKKTMSFSFDKSYWSAGDRDDPKYCSQYTLFNDLGKELLDHSFAGFNACILACELAFSSSSQYFTDRAM